MAVHACDMAICFLKHRELAIHVRIKLQSWNESAKNSWQQLCGLSHSVISAGLINVYDCIEHFLVTFCMIYIPTEMDL